MKTVKIIILFFVITGVTYSQNASSVDLSIQIGNSFRAFSNTSNITSGNQIIDSRNLHEKKFNYKIELAYSRTITDKIILKTGINYSSFNYYTSKLKDLRWPSEINGGGWEPDPNLPREIINQVNNRFLGIPLLVKFEYKSNRLNPYIEVGPTFQILTKAKFEESTNLNSETNSISNDFNLLNIFGRVGIGISYALSTENEIFGGINYRRQLNNFRKSVIVENLFDYGLNIGIRFKLAKEPSDNM